MVSYGSLWPQPELSAVEMRLILHEANCFLRVLNQRGALLAANDKRGGPSSRSSDARGGAKI